MSKKAVALRRVKKKDFGVGNLSSKFADKNYGKLDHIRKLFVPGAVYFVTTRMQEGLPLVAAEYMQFILYGIIARAQTLFNVTICHQIIMAPLSWSVDCRGCGGDTEVCGLYKEGVVSEKFCQPYVFRRQLRIWS